MAGGPLSTDPLGDPEPNGKRKILDVLILCLEILDWTGRQLRTGTRGQIPLHLAPILERLRIRASHWLELVATLGDRFRRFLGSPEHLEAAARSRGQRWFAGMRAARSAFI